MTGTWRIRAICNVTDVSRGSAGFTLPLEFQMAFSNVFKSKMWHNSYFIASSFGNKPDQINFWPSIDSWESQRYYISPQPSSHDNQGCPTCRIVARSCDRRVKTCDKRFLSMTPFSDSLKRNNWSFAKFPLPGNKNGLIPLMRLFWSWPLY